MRILVSVTSGGDVSGARLQELQRLQSTNEQKLWIVLRKLVQRQRYYLP